MQSIPNMSILTLFCAINTLNNDILLLQFYMCCDRHQPFSANTQEGQSLRPQNSLGKI